MDCAISSRFRSLGTSATLKTNEQVDLLKSSGRQIYHLAFGESRFPVHPKLLEALKDNAHQNRYLPSQGLLNLRETIALFYRSHFDLDISAAQVIVGPGSKSLIFALQMALDGELILPTPSWVSYSPQAYMLSKPVTYVPSSVVDGYRLDIEQLEKTISASTSKTKLLLLNSPNNPTGCMYEASFLKRLARVCRKHKVIVISDELYGLVPHGGHVHESIATYYPEASIVLGGVSKQLSLGGWRLGFAILPSTVLGAQLMDALTTIASEIWSSPSAPVQYAACTAYSGEQEILTYIRECTALHEMRTQYLYRSLSSLGIRCTKPMGGFYFVVSFDQWRHQLAGCGVYDSDDLAGYLLENYNLATLSGKAFGMPAEDLSLRLASSNLDLETDAQADNLLAAFREGIEPSELLDTFHPGMNEAISRFSRFVHDVSEISKLEACEG